MQHIPKKGNSILLGLLAAAFAAAANQAVATEFSTDSGCSDSGFEDLQKFSGAYLLDAYIYDTYRVGGNPLQLRLGRQVLNWGESLFVQGVNQITPVDLSALRRPGAEVREALLPVAMLNANMGLGGGHSLEAFYQFKWENTSLDSCGTYWAVTDAVIFTRPGACKALPLVTALPFDHLVFTGSTATGRHVAVAAARNLTR